MKEREFQVRYAKRDDHCLGVFTFYVNFVYKKMLKTYFSYYSDAIRESLLIGTLPSKSSHKDDLSK